MKESWKKILPLNIWNSIKKKIKPNEVYPAKEDIFQCFNYFDISQLKVIFVGNFPYQSKYSNGLSFGVKNGFDKSSIRILRDCIAIEYDDLMFEEKGFNNNLEHWAKQGILLYNISLTVPRKGNHTTHLKLWEPFSKELFEKLNKLNNLIFVFFGKETEKYATLIDRKKHKVKTLVHPEYIARNIWRKEIIGDFRGKKVFRWIDELTDNKIRWYG